MGWGEFEAGIRIFFKDPNEKVSPWCVRVCVGDMSDLLR